MSTQLVSGSAQVQTTLFIVLMHANGVSNQIVWLRLFDVKTDKRRGCLPSCCTEF